MYTLVDGVTYFLVVDDEVGREDADPGGLYHGDTRHLSAPTVAVDGADLTSVDDRYCAPSRRTRRRSSVGTAVNEITQTVASKHATVVLAREQSVVEGRFVERIALRNHRRDPRTFDLTLDFDADFADIFEVRGLREPLDRDVVADAADRTVGYAYEYDDAAATSRTLETTVSFDRDPATLAPGRATFAPSIDPQEEWRLTVEAVPSGDESTVRAADAAAGNGVAMPEADVGGTGGAGADPAPAGERADPGAQADTAGRVDPFETGPIATGNPKYDRTFAQARRDVRALTTRTGRGPVPLAGAPWFVTVFGRDALLASYFLTPVAPALARGTLRYLAARQRAPDEAGYGGTPGEIFHEVRSGELARTEVIPQTPYYGAIDATLLWIVALHETWRWTGDDGLVADLWGSFEAALEWLDRRVTAVGEDPFLYYRDLGEGGVVHRVWRDSSNGVQHHDGTGASPPLASAAIQGYLYDALRRGADLAAAVGDDADRARDLRERAGALAERFDDAFWLPRREFYATALTPAGGPVDSVTSSIGHCLWSGVVPGRRADAVVDRLLAADVFSGWGIRTLSADGDGYSPVSYHAGGVWPHDNALAALGLARYGRHGAAEEVATAQFEAFSHFERHSVPELFCGFDDAAPPAAYPSSCRPQAWSAAAPYGLLRALYDLDPDGIDDSRRPDRPAAFSREAVAPVIERWR